MSQRNPGLTSVRVSYYINPDLSSEKCGIRGRSQQRLDPPGGADASGEGADIGEHRLDEARLRLALRIEIKRETIEEDGGDDDGIGGLGEFGGLCRVFDAETDCDRNFGEFAQALDRSAHRRGVTRARAGNAGDRDVIDKAAGVVDDGREARFVAGGGGE